MKISKLVHENNIMMLEIKGEVDAYTSQDLSKTLEDMLGDGYHKIVVEVSQMTFISSAGIRAILYAHKQAVQMGGELRFVGPTDQVRRIFEITGYFEIFQISDNLEETISNW